MSKEISNLAHYPVRQVRTSSPCLAFKWGATVLGLSLVIILSILPLSAEVVIQPRTEIPSAPPSADPEQTKVFLGEKVLTILSNLEKVEVYRIDESLSGVEVRARMMQQQFLVKKSAMELLVRIKELEQAGKEKNSDEIRRLQQEKEQLVIQGKAQLAELKKEMEKNRLEEVRKKCETKEFDEFLCLNDGKIGGFPILTQGPSLLSEQMEEIRLILTDPRTYNFQTSKLCMFEPGVVFLLHRGSEVVTLLLCFTCDELAIRTGRESKGEDFDFARPRLVTLVKQLFPNDPVIQGLALSRKE